MHSHLRAVAVITSGPMYEKYNAVLRAGTGVKALTEKWHALTQGNKYTTTLHVINSCVVKLSKLTKAEKVYCGIADSVLPDEFWKPSEFGVCGGVEFGFRSTTLNREVAFDYAGGGKGKSAIVFEIQQGSPSTASRPSASFPPAFLPVPC
jgi:hypothetical protein